MKSAPPIITLLALLAVAFPAQPDALGSNAAAPLDARDPKLNYQIQPGDLLTISVWKEQDLQADVLVRPDGGLSFPLAGEQMAAGHTIDELRRTLSERLKKFIPDPVVTVSVRQLGGNRIYVVGKVNRPGEYTFSRPLDVMQSLSLAGGATSFAAVNDIRILRRDGDKQIAIPFHYEDVARGRNLEQNVLLKSGDTVIVP
jgi:polysaccharide export outer membrane protein